jgi:hypothetical protein
MKFDLNRAIEILKQTPYTLLRMLDGLSPEWTESKIDGKSWSPYDVIGHLVYGEETDWIPRAEIILAQRENRNFVPFDQEGHFGRSGGKTLNDLLTEFGHLRNANIERLMGFEITPEQLDLKGVHPEFGEVTLQQHLATWVVHDLNHIRQIVTNMAKHYDAEVGPWKEYLSILR